MSAGEGSISYSSRSGAPQGFINVAGANDGLSVNAAGFIQLGQTVGAVGDPAKLIEPREIPLSGQSISFRADAGVAPFVGENFIVGNLGDVQGRTFLSTGAINSGFGEPGYGFAVLRDIEQGVGGGDMRGFYEQTTYFATGGFASFDANSQLSTNNAITYDHLVSFQARSAFRSPGGAITNMYGFWAAMNSKAGTCTNYYNFYGAAMNTGTGVAPTVTKFVQFLMEPETRATTNWGILNQGATNNQFGSGLSTFGINGAGTIGTSTVDIQGAQGFSQLRLRTSYTPTGSADANGNTGDTAWDANFIYIKTGAGAWRRTAIAAF